MSRKVETYTEVVETTREATFTVCDRCGVKHAHPANKHGFYGEPPGWGIFYKDLQGGDGAYCIDPSSRMDLCPDCSDAVWARVRADAVSTAT